MIIWKDDITDHMLARVLATIDALAIRIERAESVDDDKVRWDRRGRTVVISFLVAFHVFRIYEYRDFIRDDSVSVP